ncbi:hypothetical protein BLOT_010920 [Blomia tropicalis]|nr:hypothetical protein BLOT_010920 [Blomia tropicalis]
MDFILQTSIPYRGMTFLGEYFTSYYEMRNGSKRIRHRQFKTLFGSIFLFRIFLHVLFYLTEITDHDQLLFICDWVRMGGISNQLNLCSAFFIFLCAYLFFRLRYSNMDKTNQKLHSVMITQNEKYFLYKYHHGRTSVYSYFRFYYKIINLIIVAPMINMTDLFIIFAQFVIISKTYKWRIHWILLTEFNQLCFSILMLIATYSLALLYVWSLIMLEIFRIQFKQLRQYFNRNMSRFNQNYYIKRFINVYTEQVYNLLIFNRMAGELIFVLFTVNGPINCYLVCNLLAYPPILATAMFAWAITVLQLLIIFLGHLAIAKTNKEIVRTAKQFLLANRFIKYSNIRIRIRSSLFSQRYYTRKNYGLTYYKFGLVTKFTFVKFILLYSQLLMFVIKEIEEQKNMEYFSSYYEMRSGTKRLQHRQFKMICGSIFSFRIFLHILFYLTDITDHDQLLFICDWVRLAALPNQLNLCSAFFLFMCAYLFFRLRYSNIDKTNQKLHSVIFIQNEQYFLQRYYHGRLSVYSYFRFYYKLINLIIVAPMIGMIELFILLSQIILILKTYKWKIYWIILTEINQLIFFLVLLVATYSLALLIVWSLILLEIFRIQYVQLRKYFYGKLYRPFRCCYFRRFINVYTEQVYNLLIFNQLAGELIFVLFTVNGPTNCYLVVQLLLYPPIISTAMFAWTISHLAIAKTNCEIIITAKQYFRANRFIKSSNQRFKIRSSLFLQRYYTTNNYGLTYYKFGLVTKFTFVKYILLYCQLLMFVIEEIIKSKIN